MENAKRNVARSLVFPGATQARAVPGGRPPYNMKIAKITLKVKIC